MNLYHVSGGGLAFCPFFNANPVIETAHAVNISCNTHCAWVVPHYKGNGDIDYFTCTMNDREVAAMKTTDGIREMGLMVSE